MYSLVKHPEYLDELLQEQNEVIATEPRDEVEQQQQDGEPLLTPNMYRRMVKLDSFIREALRVRMVGIGLAHTNVSDHNIVLRSGAVVKPGKGAIFILCHKKKIYLFMALNFFCHYMSSNSLSLFYTFNSTRSIYQYVACS